MTAARITGFLLVLLTAGCAGMECALPRGPGEGGAKQDGVPAAEPPPATASPSGSSAVKPPRADVTPSGAVAIELAAGPKPPLMSGAAEGSVVKSDAPAAKTAARVAAPPAPVAQAPKKESVAPGPEKPAAPPALDLASLEKRLRETDAIGVFTKLTLKNQVDDLLNRFRAYYQGRLKTTLAELRQPYDLLILKVLSLLQDSDPSLAGAIRSSREAIWGILSDPAKFSKL